MKITLYMAVDLCRIVESHLNGIGYHCALTGSCLYAGGSDKDVDILVYPHDPKIVVDDATMQQVLIQAGFVVRFETDGRYVNRQVWLCAYQGTRVDFFLR